jgi:hypothetical protein
LISLVCDRSGTAPGRRSLTGSAKRGTGVLTKAFLHGRRAALLCVARLTAVAAITLSLTGVAAVSAATSMAAPAPTPGPAFAGPPAARVGGGVTLSRSDDGSALAYARRAQRPPRPDPPAVGQQ